MEKQVRCWECKHMHVCQLYIDFNKTINRFIKAHKAHDFVVHPSFKEDIMFAYGKKCNISMEENDDEKGSSN